ncbi:MAG TPA: hypothetical protein VFK07_01475 [Candidatus Paceibacterota bacterium]|nr:hypothetical protein [Candidatus Paceibacterota bacterium]
MSRRRSHRIADFGREAEERGINNEELVKETLEVMRETGHIHHYLRADRHSQLDRAGIDFLIWPDSSYAVPLQVKSSARGRIGHLKHRGDTVPCCIVVDSPESLSDLAEKILRELGLSTTALEEVLQIALQETLKETA